MCGDWSPAEPEKPAATGKLNGEHRGAGRRKTRAKAMDGKKKGFPKKMFSYISSFPRPRI